MTIRPLIGSLLFASLVLDLVGATGCQARADSRPAERRFDAFTRAVQAASRRPDGARATAVGSAYDEEFAASRTALAVAGNSDLDLLFRAAQTAAFYTLDTRHVRDMTSALGELEARGLASRRHYLRAQETFVKARLLPEARRLAMEHPADAEAVPDVREAPGIAAGQSTEWVVDPGRHELLRRPVDVHRPAQVLVVSHPGCHFSRAAMRAIESDPTLREIFEVHAMWLAPPSGSFRFDAIQRWNREHPGQPITLAFRADEWPMIDSWETPTFYFLERGVVTAVVQGWPDGGRRGDIASALRRVGLSKPPPGTMRFTP